VLREVSKDEVFFKRSGGGLTISGGEPFMQPDFLQELLEKAKKDYSLHTAVETTCCTNPDIITRAMPYLDYVICDIKLMDSTRHKVLLGVPNETILENIAMIARNYPDKDMLLRLTLIPGVNDDDENIKALSDYITQLPRRLPLELLFYHEYGKSKYQALGKTYPLENREMLIPDKGYMAEKSALFEKYNVQTVRT